MPSKKSYKRPEPRGIVAIPAPAYIPSGTPEGKPSRANVHNPVFSSVPVLNTTLIPPLIPTGPNELAFADMVWAGLTPYLSYREVYGVPTDMRMDRVYEYVNRKLWSRAVRVRMHQLDKMAADMDTKNADNRRNFVLDGLTQLASDDSISPMARLKALELLGKVRGTDLFTDKVEHVVQNMSEEQVKAALAEKLAQLGAGSLTGTSDLAKEIKVIEHVPTKEGGE
jgi:hypothetical protein